MLKSIIVTNYLGDSLTLELTRPEKSGLIVTKVTGLGPPKAEINTDDVANNDGASYNSARVTKRNIVIDLKYMFSPTIEASRLKTYKYFPIKKNVKLRFITDNRDAEIIGYVESNEPDIFSKDSGTTISIVCPDSYFNSSETQSTIFSGVEPMFEFPFENDSLSEPLIEFGRIMNLKESTVYYMGDALAGVNIFINSLGSVVNVT